MKATPRSRHPRHFERPCSLAATVAIVALFAGSTWAPSAEAGSRVWLHRTERYLVEWGSGAHKHSTYLPVQRTGAVAVDACFQISPDGVAAAARGTPPLGLLVWDKRGSELLRVPDHVLAFRFSPDGKRLVFASEKQIWMFDLGSGVGAGTVPGKGSDSGTGTPRGPHALARLTGVESLRFTDAGPVALVRTGRGHQLALIDASGAVRTLASARRIDAMVAAKKRVAYFVKGSVVTIDLEASSSRTIQLDEPAPVGDAELSFDGTRLLFSTAKRVFLREGEGPVQVVAEADAHSIHFSPDGSAFLWAASDRGELKQGDRMTPLLPRLRSARFRNDGPGLVATTEESVATIDPVTGEQHAIGGISVEDGENLAGDTLGGVGISINRHKSGHEKAHQAPATPLP